MAINFNTNNLIIVCYPGWAGGKFLINCLGLSDDAVFQSAALARMQLEGNFSQKQKSEYLKNESDKIENTWNDLNLGCWQLFGINSANYHTLSADKIRSLDSFNPIMTELTASSKKFFIVAHSGTILEKILKVWPNARIIYFKNCTSFINFRKNDSVKYFDIIMSPYQILGEHTLSLKDKNKIISNAIPWDAENYWSSEKTICELKKLYNILTLSNFNEKIIAEYHTLWIDKLKELRDK